MATVARSTTSVAPPPTTNLWAVVGRASLRVLVPIAAVVVSFAVLFGLWQLTITLLNPSRFLAQTPLDVWKYLFMTDRIDPGTPASRRADLLSLLAVTLGHAAIGLVLGVGASVLVAVTFALVPTVRRMFMPLAMVLRTVPLLAMAPVIYIVFGTGIVTAALVGAAVTFFPLLVNLSLGFRSATVQAVDLVLVYGGTRWTIMRKVAIPTALPHFLASMRIAVPATVSGAMLYEWLFTFQGLGAAIVTSKSFANYGEMWTIVVIATIVSVVLYQIVGIIESVVLASWGPNAGRASQR
jgi:ABC-type nitrate/sulfonate/bicarbonate transport system permease component